LLNIIKYTKYCEKQYHRARSASGQVVEAVSRNAVQR